MTDPTSWNAPADAPAPPAPEAPVAPVPTSEPAGAVGKRTALIAGGAGAAALLLGAVAFLVLTGGEGEDGALDAVPRTTQSAGPSPSATAAPLPTGLPTVSTVNGRNPFASRETPESSVAGGTEGGSTSGATTSGSSGATTSQPAPTVTRTVAVPGPTTTVAGPTTTVTSTSPSGVYLTLFNLEVDESATFLVNGTRYDVVPGDTFGPQSRFTYDDTVVSGVETCTEVTYVDAPFTVCPGDQIDVS